jgi:hypothetical protein
MKSGQEFLLAKEYRPLNIYETENVKAYEAELCHGAQENRPARPPTLSNKGYGWFSRG